MVIHVCVGYRAAEIARQQASYQAEQKQLITTNRIKAESAAVMQNKRMETCNFWANEFKKSKLEGDKYHKNNSCRDAGINFN